MESLFFCSIHQDTLENPSTLHCGHNFCIECLYRVIENKKIKCPLCKNVTPLPNGQNSLAVNVALQ